MEETDDGINPAGPDAYYTTITGRVLVYKAVQGLYDQQNHGRHTSNMQASIPNGKPKLSLYLGTFDPQGPLGSRGKTEHPSRQAYSQLQRDFGLPGMGSKISPQGSEGPRYRVCRISVLETVTVVLGTYILLGYLDP